MDWDQYFISMMYLVAMKSKDRSTKIGAIIVGSNNEIRSTGYNGLPRGVDDTNETRQVAPEKYFWYEHGERNSIFNAARVGIPTDGCKMYTQGIPCADCARAVIQSGIKEIIFSSAFDFAENRQKWIESCAKSQVMLDEAGVKVRDYKGDITTNIFGLRGGKTIELRKQD